MIHQERLQELRMRRSAMGRWLSTIATKLPMSVRPTVLGWVVRSEGGQMTSQTLRDYLSRVHGIEIGDFSYGALLDPRQSDRGLVVGRYVSIGPGVRRFGAAHPTDRLSMHPFWYNPALQVVSAQADVQRNECVIGHEAWIGADVKILPGCTSIGIGAVIGAGTVLTRDVPDFAVVVGVPGRVVSQRFSSELQEKLLQEQPWQKSPEQAAEAYSRIAAGSDGNAVFIP